MKTNKRQTVSVCLFFLGAAASLCQNGQTDDLCPVWLGGGGGGGGGGGADIGQ